MNWTYYGLILVQTNEGILAKSGISQYAILEMNHWGERSGSTCGFLVFGHWYNINMYIHIPEVCMYIEWHGATNLFRYIYIYIYIHAHKTCILYIHFERSFKRKGEQETRGYHHTKVLGLACWQWCWRVCCLILVGPWSSWRMHGVVKPGFFGGIFKGWQKPHWGKKGIQKLDLWQSCEFFFFDKKSHSFLFKKREEFPEKGDKLYGNPFFKWQIKWVFDRFWTGRMMIPHTLTPSKVGINLSNAHLVTESPILCGTAQPWPAVDGMEIRNTIQVTMNKNPWLWHFFFVV